MFSFSNEMAGIRLRIETLPAFNYAFRQNHIDYVSRISISNSSDTALRDVVIRLSSESDLIIPYTKQLDLLPQGGMVEISPVPFDVNGEKLAASTEKVVCGVDVTLTAGEERIIADRFSAEILAYDQWQGSDVYPEQLCAFVMPNDPEIGMLLDRASTLLGKWTGDPSLDAYQSMDPNRVYKQAAAVYEAIKSEQINYCVAPAGFEEVGQRIRLTDTVLAQKRGNCLELSLLYASALEAIGLHPLLILTETHAFAGVWLEEKCYPDAVFDDASPVTGLMADGINEVTVVESTAVCRGLEISFEEAVSAAKDHFYDGKSSFLVIDVNRARLNRVCPMPRRVLTESGWKIERAVPKRISAAAPSELTYSAPLGENVPKTLTKKDQWGRKLLDLGLRNSLISMRPRSVIPLLSDNVDELENALSGGEDFSLCQRPADVSIRDDSFESLRLGSEYETLFVEELKNKRIYSAYTEGALNAAVKNLYRGAKTALEESGANTLYMIFGLLKWFETPKSTKPRYAPLVMIPIEMVRKSAASGYRVRLREDEPQFNITLLEKLKQDFDLTITGLDPLPRDSAGIDTRQVFTIVRKSILGMKNWDVLESAYVGNFSFTQFVMWNDIQNRSGEIEKNKIVKSLMDGKLAWDAEDMEIGESVPEDDVLTPLPADASQLFAIREACRGKSFVLHGPPGTGKSQAITNLIANALANGKRVLFVAEKMAALEVVQKRLNQIGIGEFCLELHSNKSRKKDVLEQLRVASEVTKAQSADAFARKAGRARELREELSKYGKKLHQKTGCGLSVFDMIGIYDAYKGAQDLERFPVEYMRSLSAAEFDNVCHLPDRLIAAAKEIGHPKGHPLIAIRSCAYSQDLRFALPELLTSYRTALTELEASLREFRDLVPEVRYTTKESCEAAASAARELLKWQEYPAAWCAEQALESRLNDLVTFSNHARCAEKDLALLSKDWTREFLELDGNALLLELRTNETKWGPIKTMARKKFQKKLQPYAAAEIGWDTLEGSLQTLSEYQREKREAQSMPAACREDAAFFRAGEGTDWNRLTRFCEDARESERTLTQLTGSNAFRQNYSGKGEVRVSAKRVNDAYAEYAAVYAELDRRLTLVFSGENWLPGQLSFCDALQAHSDEIREWMNWRAVEKEAVDAGLANVVRAYYAGMRHEEILPAFWKTFAFSGVIAAIDQEPALQSFSGAVFNEKIAQFKQLDREMTELTRQEIRCRLAAGLPNMTREAAQSSEIGILQRAIRNNGRGQSIRKLFEQIPNLLPRLCPCMLMSPISVAQYLDPAFPPFDLVVFDEASQLPTCKAIGALGRGNSAVIVGDPKQMPPTAFFTSNSPDEENLELEDLESILDDCLALNIPQTHLLWHYRSRHESLIAFSNRQFYENKLYTFPSVNDRERKVRLVHVDGIFEHGKSRQNRNEAKAVVAEIVRRYRDPALSGQSIGVVTFNVNQQNLIDDLLNEEFRADPALEKWAAESKEPIFIKNLENVQGDERDVILFSIAYGPDADGKVSMNFGPLNRDGGWRRLNVAASRARCEMVVFATLTADQIDLNRTSAQGVAALKAFLQYASGKELPETAQEAKETTKTGIIESICRALRENGWETDTSVGHSEYRIDIGVIDPENENKYLLGILLDGSAYASAKTVRDREVGQIGVLEGLGWNVLRVWSVDWWDNSKKELDRILKAIEKAKTARTAEKDSAAAVPEPLPAKKMTVESSTAAKSRTEAPVSRPAPESGEEWLILPYKSAALREVCLTPEELLSGKYNADTAKRMLKTIKEEGPISEKLLFKNVTKSYGISRTGTRIQEYLDEIVKKLPVKVTEENGQIFYWDQTQTPEAYYVLKVNDGEENARDVREITIHERVNSVCYVLEQQISLSGEDLIREAAKVLGFTRLGANVTAVYQSTIDFAETNKLIERGQNGSYRLAELGNRYAAAAKNAKKSAGKQKTVPDAAASRPGTESPKTKPAALREKEERWYCISCGKRLTRMNAKFCEHCGEKQDQ